MTTFLTIYAILCSLSLVFIFLSERTRKYANISETLQFSEKTTITNTLCFYMNESQKQAFIHIQKHKKVERFPIVNHQDVSQETQEWHIILGYSKEEIQENVCELYETKTLEKTTPCIVGKSIEIVSIVKNICETAETKTQERRKLTREERYERNIGRTIAKRQAKRNKTSKKTSL